MGSKTKSTYIEDRISELPDEILCRILSFLNTKEAVKTSILSHRWNNVWAFVPNLDFSVCSPKMVSDRCVRFVDRVLSSRGSSNIHRLRLGCADIEDYFSRIESWICSAIARKVVELDLCLDSNSSQYYELPTSLFMCNTLEVLKLQIKSNLVITKPPPTSKCFPSLKFLHVTLYDPNSDSFGYLFSCCPALEDLIIVGNLRGKPVSHFNISAPKLKRLRICLRGTLMDSNCINGSHASRIYVDAPNLETLHLEENFMAAYFLKNKDCLRRAKIYLRVLSINNVVLDHADHLCKLFAGIVNVGNLSFSAPILEVPEIMDRCHVPTLHNLNHLKLHLQTCCSWKSLTKWLNISPNLEHLVFTKNNYYCVWKDKERYHELEHDQWRPELVPICLLSRLKTICIRGFWGWPHEMEVLKYLLKHGEVLNNLTIVYTTGLCVEELQQELSKLPRGSKTCQVMAGSSRHYLQCLCS